MASVDHTRESAEQAAAPLDTGAKFAEDAYARCLSSIEEHPGEAVKTTLEVAAAIGAAAAVAYIARGNAAAILKTAGAFFRGNLAESVGLEPVGSLLEGAGSLTRGEKELTFAERSGIYNVSAARGAKFEFGSTFEGIDRNSAEFQGAISSKMNLDLQKLESGKMAILHPRFKYPEKQLLGKISEKADLSLWGEPHQGMGVVEYADVNAGKKYFAGAKSVVRITSRGDEAQAAEFAHRGASGVFIGRPDQGLVLTNEHVVADTASLSVETLTGDRFAAKVIAANTDHDLAVIQLTDAPASMEFPVASLTDRPYVGAGEKVAAIGHPGALKGLIASPGRYENFDHELQTDIFQLDSANYGSSGGPVFDRWGHLVSVVKQGVDSTDPGFRTLAGGANIRQIRDFVEQVNSILAEAKPSVGP